MKNRIILASASPRRKDLLAQVGMIPEIIPSEIEEIITSTEPEQVVKELALQKAADVAGRVREAAYIVGADTVVSVDGKILGKPKTTAEAAKMIRLIQGTSHQVYTGVAVLRCDVTGTVIDRTVFAEKTDVWVYEMTEEEIMTYAESGEPMDKAGAYGIQGAFAAYVKGICGDYNNVVGLPVGRLCREIKQMERKVFAHD